MGERIAGTLILLLLVGIGAGLVVRQLSWMEAAPERAAERMDASPAVAPAPSTEPHGAASPLGALLPGWPPASGVEHYDAESLFQKINGHAPLYLDAGFEGLEAQRFTHPDDPEGSVELRLYTMASAEGAASVRAQTARPGGEPPGPDLDGQCVEGACFVAHGPHYLEVLPSPAGPEVEENSRAVVLAFVEATGG